MKLLLDESLPRRLKGELRGHEVVTVPEMGWAGKSNGELLQLAEGPFDAFLTIDQNLEYQQNLEQLGVPVVLLVGPSSRFDDLKKLVPKILTVLGDLKPGEIVRVMAR